MSRSSSTAAARLGTTFLLAALLVPSAPAFAAGFAIPEQGAKALGLANAFTGQADDVSALYFNPGGLAFLREPEIQVGLTLIHIADSSFEGLAPFPGPGAAGELENNTFFPPHFYYGRPLGDRLTFAAGLTSPFGLGIEWQDPEIFAGRFINVDAELRALDLNAGIGYQLSDNFGVGVGVIGRFSDISLEQFVPAVDPFTQTVADVATANLESDFDTGAGFTAGFLHQLGQFFSWGAQYRSEIEIDFGGEGMFTQLPTGNPVLDAVVATQLPFGQNLPVAATITFPDFTSLGISVGFTHSIRVNVDVNWTGWSSFDVLELAFPEHPQLTSIRPQLWDDTVTYRAGVAIGNGNQWRFGVVLDETPQPLETAGPILPDGDRTGYSVGYGADRFDLAVLFIENDEITTTTNLDGFFGTYQSEAVLLSGTFKF